MNWKHGTWDEGNTLHGFLRKSKAREDRANKVYRFLVATRWSFQREKQIVVKELTFRRDRFDAKEAPEALYLFAF